MYSKPAIIFINVQKLVQQCGGKKTLAGKIVMLLNKMQPAMHHVTYGLLGNLGSVALNASHSNIMPYKTPVYDKSTFQQKAQTLFDSRNHRVNRCPSGTLRQAARQNQRGARAPGLEGEAGL